jgi:AraC-like DNA-binding protein
MPAIPATPRAHFSDLKNVDLSLALGPVVADFIDWWLIEPKWWRNYLHSHSFYEICYAFVGRGRFTINGRTQTVRRGDVFVAKPNEPHEIVSSRSAPLGIYFWSYTLVPAAKRPPRPVDAATDELLRAFIGTTTLPAGPAPHMAQTIAMLTDEIARQWPGCLPVIEALTRKLLLDTARAVVPEGTRPTMLPAVSRSEADRIAQAALRYVHDNLARPISVRDVAAQVQLSERHLERLVRKETGRTVLQHLTAARVDAAAQQLLDHDVPIKQIAAGVGYQDVRYFTTLFRKRTGMTPARFRAAGGTTHFTAMRHAPQ